MGSRYQTNTASGYNSSPPADDGSQTAANLVTWAGTKTKLGDPIKTLAEDINSDLLTAFDYSVRQITASDSIAATDHMRTVEIAPTVTNAITVTLPDAATMTSNFIVRIRNSCLRNQTITRATGADTIDGTAGNVTIPAGGAIAYTTNAAANGYLTIGVSGPFVDSDAVIVGGTDGTKKIRFEADSITAGTTRVFTARDADFEIGAATQAEQETGTSLVASVTPGRQQFHPSAAKGWVMAQMNGMSAASYNVASVTDNGVGDVTANWTVSFSSATYSVVCIPKADPGAGAAGMYVAQLLDTSFAAGSARCQVLRPSDGAAVDPNHVMFAAYGDQ